MCAPKHHKDHTAQNAVPDDWISGSHVQALVLTGLTLFGIYLCYRLAAPFVSAITWALALAVLFTPVQRWLERRVLRPGVAAMVAVLAIALVVAVPATFVAQRLLAQAAHDD
ncbi:MAG: AI-2E family transporter [Verrucomicrobiae bacterium]|nr:AI-2E family transporter [Verrucomicrobiae bacterium]